MPTSKFSDQNTPLLQQQQQHNNQQHLESYESLSDVENDVVPPQKSNSQDQQQQRQQYSLRDQLDGFPFWQMAIVMIVRFSEPVSFTSLFPYVYFMVKHLQPGISEANIARYSGYISGSFALCQALTGVHWGRYSDKYGRKPILLIGLMGSAISLFWFGSATSYFMAMIARCFGGFLNGNVGVIRTAIGEIAPRRRHQALAMSTMSLLWQLGCVVGPVIGGTLADPIKNHPGWFNSDDQPAGPWKTLFTKRPFLLPNLVTSSLLFFSTVGAFLFLEETHPDFRARNFRDPGLIIGDNLLEFFSRGKINQKEYRKRQLEEYEASLDSTDVESNSGSEVSSQKTKFSSAHHGDDATTESTSHLLTTDEIVEEDLEYISGEFTSHPHSNDHHTEQQQQQQVSSTIINPATSLNSPASATSSKNYDIDSDGGFFEALTAPVLATIAMYFLLALHTIVFDELLPVMLSTSIITDPENGGPSRLPFHFVGGLGLSSVQVGHLLSIMGALGTALVMFYFPYVDGKYGTYAPFTLVNKLFPLVYFAMPYVLLLADENDNAKNAGHGFTKSMYGVLLILISKTLLMALAFPGVMLLINRAITNRKHTGGINGLSQMFAAISRAIGPIAWGLIMAKGQELQLAELPWWTLSIVTTSSFFLIAILNKYRYVLDKDT